MLIEKIPTIYILGNENLTLYIGVTSQLLNRVWQHKKGVAEGFTKKYKIHLLLYYEVFETMEQAIIREKQLKSWNRQWKLDLIIEKNPDFEDLYEKLFDDEK